MARARKTNKKNKSNVVNKNLNHYLSKLIDVGIVSSCSDGIIVVEDGLTRAYIGEVVAFGSISSNIIGIVMDLARSSCKIALLNGDEDSVQAGDKVYLTRKGVRTKVGLGTIGRINNPLGVCLNANDFSMKEFTLQEAWNIRLKEVEVRAPSIIEREPVRSPVLTGVPAIDVMLPIGCGQRELIIGDNGSGKTTLALTVILQQHYKNQTLYRNWRLVESTEVTYRHRYFVPCIYVVIGGKRSEMSRIQNLLNTTEAIKYTTVVFASASDLAAMQYIAPFSGCAVGEWFRDNGFRSIVVYDELLNHAAAYRQISLLLRRPPGREAYPGDIFYLHARLLERSAQLKRNLGGGALTALPLVETRSGDISAYIPTNIISITDGQVFLNTKLGNSGIKPAIDLNLSVSRVGSDAQYPIMKFISKKVKLAYGAYRNLKGLEKVSSSLDFYTKLQINKGKRIVEYFKQGVFETEHLYQQIISLYAIVEGFMDDIKPEMTRFYVSLMFRPEVASSFLRDQNKSLLYLVSHMNSLNTVLMSVSAGSIIKDIHSFIDLYHVSFKEHYQYKYVPFMQEI